MCVCVCVCEREREREKNPRHENITKQREFSRTFFNLFSKEDDFKSKAKTLKQLKCQTLFGRRDRKNKNFLLLSFQTFEVQLN